MTRDELIARVALLSNLEGPWDDPDRVWKVGEAWVAEREKVPDEPVQCPCCTKLVTLCLEHYELREPGQPCADCLVKGEVRVRLLQVLLSKAGLEARRRNYWI